MESARLSQSKPVYVCEICQTVLDEHHCKAICPNCGRMLDCSDLPGIQANAIAIDGLVAPRPGYEPDFRPADKIEPRKAPDGADAPTADIDNVP